MQLTTRDLALLRWINGFGFVDIEHISKKLVVKKPTAYARMQKLVSADYLVFERIFHARNGVYRVTQQGAKIASDSLPALKKINIGQYEHDLAIVQVVLNLMEKDIQLSFVTERQIKSSQGIRGVGTKGHLSDGYFLQNDKKIALEVELSSKSQFRREAIIRYYTKNLEYDEVWYMFADPRIENQLKPLVIKRPFIKLFDLKSFGVEINYI